MFATFKLQAQQNTILIIADDLGNDYLGFYPNLGDTAKVPNIRTLLTTGIRFTRVWAAPVCSPARAGIFTGRYSFRTGVGNVISSATSPQLDTAEMSIAKLLRDYAPQKYNTANIGKWHLHVQTPAKWLYPNRMGYDLYSGNFNGQIPNYYQYTRIKNGVMDTVTTYATTQTVNDALAWMDTMNTTKPFFLWLAFNAPHNPFHLPPASLCDTSGLSGTATDISANPKKYFKAAIQAMDTEIGRLLQYLDAHNLRDSTNIIFIGDNGNETQVAQIANPNKAKATIYDYGVHVPMIVSGPAVVNPNRSSDALINTPDLFATIAELSGFTNWSSFIPAAIVVDSRSMLPIIKNQSTSIRSWSFTEQFQNPSIAADGKTIRDQQYHLLRFDNGTQEFYDLDADPEENSNLLLSPLNAVQTAHYQFLCDTISALLGNSMCSPNLLAYPEVDKQIRVYPNPAQDELQIAGNFRSYILLNVLGECIQTGMQNQIAVDDIPSGYYLLRITGTDAMTHFRKIVIRH